MTSAPARLYDTDSMEQVMRTFDDTKAWNLPVVDAENKYWDSCPSRRYSTRIVKCWYIFQRTEDMYNLPFTMYNLPFGVLCTLYMVNSKWSKL